MVVLLDLHLVGQLCILFYLEIKWIEIVLNFNQTDKDCKRLIALVLNSHSFTLHT